MRIHHWLTAITSLLATLVVGTTSMAQSGAPWPPEGGGPIEPGPYVRPAAASAPLPAYPGSYAYPGSPPFQPAFTSGNPQALYPPGTPPGYQPFPAVSPHLNPNVMQDQHYQRNGMWINESTPRDRDWYGGIDYLHINFDGPGGARIGSNVARLNPLSGQFPPINTWPSGGPITFPAPGIPRGPGAFPYVFMKLENDDPLITAIIDDDLFPIRNMSIFGDSVDSSGVRLRTGFFEQDGTGFGLESWWGFQGHDFVQYGSAKINGIPITQDLLAGIDLDALPPGAIPGVWPEDAGEPFNFGGFLLSAKVGAVPYIDNSGLGDALFPGTGINGFTQKYDILYRVDVGTQAGGVNANFFLGHIYKRPHVQIRSFVAAKYLYVDEFFRFRGIDSGFDYEVDVAGDDGAPTFRPIDGTILGPRHPLLVSVLSSDTKSHLGGPEFGLRGDLGQSKGFKLWWQGSAGLLVNHERTQVEGNNIGAASIFHNNPGDPDNDDDGSGFGQISPAFDMFANDTSFDDIEHHTHISPSLQLGINTELDIFEVLPYFKKVSLFDTARLTLGYNLISVGNVARPADSIKWRGFPDFPSVRVNRDIWTSQQYSIGLNFER